MTAKRKPSKRKKKTGRTALPYPFEFRQRLVRLYLEEGYEASLLAQEFNISEYGVPKEMLTYNVKDITWHTFKLRTATEG